MSSDYASPGLARAPQLRVHMPDDPHPAGAGAQFDRAAGIPPVKAWLRNRVNRDRFAGDRSL